MGASLPRYHPQQLVTIAANLRTTQFVEALQAAEHEVIIIGSDYHGAPLNKGRWDKCGEGYYHTDLVGEKLHKQIKWAIKKHKPDCLVGITVWPSMELVKVGSKLPMWIDIFGNTMTEAQLKCAEVKDNRYLKRFWGYEKMLLERGDKFSGCSTRQEHFMTGELAVLGRLSAETHGYQFVHSIPPGIPESVPAPTWDGPSIRNSPDESLDSPNGEFIVLWTGGYNLWTDIKTLFEGLELAMAENDRVRFVSFGGAIAGHDEWTYPRFVKMIEGSQFRDRFTLLGWQPYQRMLKALTEADVGICIDKWHYELVYGTRTRLTQMIAYGLPVITTEGCEFVDSLKERTGINVFKMGNASHLASHIIALAEGRPWKPSSGGFSYQATCQPLLDWCKNPMRAPESKSSPVYDSRGEGDIIAGLIEHAECLIREKRDALAIGCLKTALELCPWAFKAAYHLGSLYERQGHHDHAQELFAKAMQDPTLRAGALYHYACNISEPRTQLIHLDECLWLCPSHKAAKKLRRKLKRCR